MVNYVCLPAFHLGKSMVQKKGSLCLNRMVSAIIF